MFIPDNRVLSKVFTIFPTCLGDWWAGGAEDLGGGGGGCKLELFKLLAALPDAIVLLTSGGIYGLRGRRFSKLAKFWLLFETLAVVTNACGEFDIGGIPVERISLEMDGTLNLTQTLKG